MRIAGIRLDEKAKAILFFIGGFIFDIITLKRIDNWIFLSLQGGYLFLLWFILFLEIKYEAKQPSKLLARLWPHREKVSHFMLGALLSAYIIMFSKSFYQTETLFFIAILVAIALGNEVFLLAKSRRTIKVCLIAFCSLSYLAYFVPIIWRSYNDLLLYVSFVVMIIGISALIYSLLKTKLQHIIKEVFLPSFLVMSFYALTQTYHLIPPVPSSLRSAGVFNSMEKSDDGHYLFAKYVKDPSSDSNDIYVKPEERVYFFAEIFAPLFFKEKIEFHWFWLDPKTDEWSLKDVIASEIQGGRETGFRTYAVKENFLLGTWQVQVVIGGSKVLGIHRFQIFNRGEESVFPLKTAKK